MKTKGWSTDCPKLSDDDAAHTSNSSTASSSSSSDGGGGGGADGQQQAAAQVGAGSATTAHCVGYKHLIGAERRLVLRHVLLKPEHLPKQAPDKRRKSTKRNAFLQRTSCGVENAFWSHFYIKKRSLCQDRLGTNLSGNAEKEPRSLQAGSKPCEEARPQASRLAGKKTRLFVHF
jgi:hypothetical protein